jgi:hypothetical protein
MFTIAKTTTPAPNNCNCTAIKPNYKWENYTWRDFPVAKFPVHVPRTFVNAVQHLRDYGTFSPVNRNRGRSRSRRVLDLERWSLKFCKLLRKNRMLVADDLHYEWVFPVSQFGERCTNKDYILIIFNVSNT